ncbi:MAG: tubulin-like doman-containing protein [Candidatus Cloacimonetes bacterium]|nr:tubulin-like doman-containing protein [Candidatus Cloacimonadota bacterium]
MRFRRKLVNIYDGLENHPYIEYLWIDTDSRNTNIRNADFDKTFSHARLSNSEIVDVSMTVKELQGFYDRFDGFTSYHHWFNYNALRGMGAAVLQQGASAMRPFGKLAFWYHADRIHNSISNAITKLKSPNLKVQNLSSAMDIDVYVIGSLAGGTGSGMVIDIAAMLQKIDANIIRTGIFFLSDVFAHDESNPVKGSQTERDANCFAALQELDFYLTPENQQIDHKNKNLFDFSWKESLRHSVTLPVYNKVNLVSNAYENGQIEPSLEEAFNIVAEYLILGYNDTSFDADVRSARTNVRKGYSNKFHLVNMISQSTKNGNQKVSNAYSTTYTGLGLGLVEFNKRRIKNWAKYNFLASFCDDLSSSTNSDPSIYTDRNGKIKYKLLDPEKLWTMLETGASGVSPIDDMMQEITRKRANKVQQLLEMPEVRNGDFHKIDSIKQKISTEVDTFFTGMLELVLRETSDDTNFKGKISSSLQNNLAQVLEELPLGLINLYYIVLGSIVQGGVSSAKSLLEDIKRNRLTLMKKYLQDQAPGDFVYQAPDELKLPDATNIQDIQNYAREASDIPLFFVGYRKKAERYYQNNLSGAQARYTNELKKAIESYAVLHENQLKKFLTFTCYRIISEGFNRALALIEQTVDALVLNEHDKANTFLRNWKMTFEDYAAAFDFKNVIAAQRKLVLDNYLEAEIKQALNDIVQQEKENGYQGFLAELAKKLNNKLAEKLNEYSLGQSPSMFFAYAVANHQTLIQNDSVDLKALLEECAATFLGGFIKDKTVDTELLKLLQKNELRNDLESNIRKVFEQSCMRLSFIAEPQVNKRMKEEEIPVNGINANASPALINELDKILGRVVGFNRSNLDESIVFFKEGSGFPIVALSPVNALRTAFYDDISGNPGKIYQRYTTKDFEHLRTLKCMNDKQFREFSGSYLTAMKALLMGIISYEKIDLSNNQSEWRFRYRYRFKGIDEQEDLLKQIETIADELLQPNRTQVRERIQTRAELDELSVKELLYLIGAVSLNIRELRKDRDSNPDKVASGCTTMGTWAMERIRDMIEAQLKQKMAIEYPEEKDMAKYIDDLYDQDFNPQDYQRLDYYTSEFVSGILVTKPRNP